MSDIKNVVKCAKELNQQIENLFKLSTFDECGDLSYLEYDPTDSEQIFHLEEMVKIMENLFSVRKKISHITYPVKEVSKLHKDTAGRYETDGGYYYTSGTGIEVLVSDEYHKVPYWKRTCVEHDGKDYYIVGYKDTPLDSVTVRVRQGEGY